MHEEVVDTFWELGGDRSGWKNPFGDTPPSPLGVIYFLDVRSRWSFTALRDALQPLTLRSKEKNSFKA